MLVECSTCPVRNVRCDDCVVRVVLSFGQATAPARDDNARDVTARDHTAPDNSRRPGGLPVIEPPTVAAQPEPVWLDDSYWADGTWPVEGPWPLDAEEERAVGCFVSAGLVSRGEAAGLVAWPTGRDPLSAAG